MNWPLMFTLFNIQRPYLWSHCELYNVIKKGRPGTHLANFDEKVHKPQSKSYGRIGANIKLIFINFNTSISASSHFFESEELQGTHIDALNPFSSKLMILTLKGGL